MNLTKKAFSIVAALTGLALIVTAPSAADQVILDDLIVDGSICAGFDCVNGESFGFDTLRLKENNLRIRAQDTSTSASFPTNDWQITFNDTSNGGANKFSIDDIDGGRTPFTITAGAPSHSLFITSAGRIGIGTSTPVAEVHIKDGDSPTLRLEQDGTSGFTPQTWDVVGNETNFFVRDATNGSQLPLRIRPGADSNSLFVDTDNDVGMGTSSPGARLHVLQGGSSFAGLAGTSGLYQNNASSADSVFVSLISGSTGNSQISFGDTTNGQFDGRIIYSPNLGAMEFRADNTVGMTLTGANLAVMGTISSGGMVLNVPDYVFESDYDLRSISELRAFITENKHLPNVPSAREIRENGLNHSEFQMSLLEKIEELTLYTLAQEQTISELAAKVADLQESDGQ